MLVYLTPGPHTVRGLARVLGVSKPVVTRALNTLGALGYLRRERDQDDRRNVFVVRTSSGADFLEGFKRNLRERRRRLRRAPADHRPGATPTPTSAEDFALDRAVRPARPRLQRLSQGPRRRRARRPRDRLALCRAGRAPDRPGYGAAGRAVGRMRRRSASLASASRSRCSTTASAGPGAMPARTGASAMSERRRLAPSRDGSAARSSW